MNRCGVMAAALLTLALTGCHSTRTVAVVHVSEASCDQQALPDTSEWQPDGIMGGFDFVSSDTVVRSQAVAVVTVLRVSESRPYTGAPVTTLDPPMTAVPVQLHVDRVIKGNLPACVADLVTPYNSPAPQAAVGQRFLAFGYPPLPAPADPGHAADRPLSEYIPLGADGMLFFRRDGVRRSVDSWQPSPHELYDPIPECPDGPGPNDPKDCFGKSIATP